MKTVLLLTLSILASFLSINAQENNEKDLITS
jgi:hypothetical protein